MEEECQYSQFIYGRAKAVDKLPKEELLEVKSSNSHVKLWAECFIHVLISNKMQVDEFITHYKEFKAGNRTAIWELDILPANLKKNKRLAIKYIEALVYVTFKRDLNKILTTVPVHDRIGDPYYN